jgi:hypothetical protein
MGIIWKWPVKMDYKTRIFPSIGLFCLVAFSTTAIGADDFALVRKVNLSPASTPMKGFSSVDSFGLSRDSGILIAGQFHDEHDVPMAFVMKITPQAVAQWQLLSAHEPLYDPPTGIFDASDGSYWEIGTGHIEDPSATKASSLKWNERTARDINATYFYLGKIDAGGHIGWRKPITGPGLSHMVACGSKSPDGVIVSGSTDAEYEGSPDGKFGASAPWIEKLDLSGTVVWERTIAEDEDKILSIPFDSLTSRTCAGIQVSPSGDIAWAVTVDAYAKKRTGGRTVVESEQRSATANPMTLIIALDKDGKETRRVRSLDSNSAFLLTRGDGYTLVDHFRPHLADALLKLPPVLSVAATLPAVKAESGARITTFNSHLDVITSDKIAYRGFNDRLRAVLPTEDGGYYVIGCSIDLAENHLAYIDSKTKIVRSIKLGQGQCAYFGLASTPASNDVLVYSSVSEASPHLFTLRPVIDSVK